MQGCCLLQERVEELGVEASWRIFEKNMGERKKSNILGKSSGPMEGL